MTAPPFPEPDPPLADERVALRPWRDADVPWLTRESRDPLVPRFTTVPADNSEAHVRGFLLAHGPLRERGEQVHLLGVERATGELVGPVGLHHVDWPKRQAEVGYWTARASRGRGLTAAAVRLICAWAFDELELERLELRTHPENVASQRLAERLGFTREGLLRGAERRPAGRVDLVLFGLLAGELT